MRTIVHSNLLTFTLIAAPLLLFIVALAVVFLNKAKNKIKSGNKENETPEKEQSKDTPQLDNNQQNGSIVNIQPIDNLKKDTSNDVTNDTVSANKIQDLSKLINLNQNAKMPLAVS